MCEECRSRYCHPDCPYRTGGKIIDRHPNTKVNEKEQENEAIRD